MHTDRWHRGLIIGLLLLAIFWLSSLIWGLAGKAKIAVTQAGQVEGQYRALEDRKAALQANLAALSTARGQDAAIRTAFGVARPGEEVIVVVPPATSTASTTKSWWSWLWSWF